MAEDIWQEAVDLFDAAQYWDCHEVLEPLWLQSSGDAKAFYGGIILLAAALHKARVMGSQRGGRRNYAKALRHLAILPDTYHGIDVRELEAVVHSAMRNEAFQPKLLQKSR